MQRLDAECVARKIFSGRDRASEEIKKGLVKVNGKIETKPSTKVSNEDEIIYLGEENILPRASLKLKEAIKEFKIDLKGLNAIDIGASTGGFTFIMLEEGTSSVTCVDVGHGQLHENLIIDKRVRNIEGYNFRYAKKEDFPLNYDFFTIDVSFISVTLLIDGLEKILTEPCEGVVLIKPQFECGRGALNSKGVVTKEENRNEAIKKVSESFLDKGFSIENIITSPIKGPEGNVEFLMHLKYNGSKSLRGE